MKHSTQKHMIAFVLMILVGGCFVSVQSAQAIIVDQDSVPKGLYTPTGMNPLMYRYTGIETTVTLDKTATNVQNQTSDAVSSGRPYPIPSGWSSAIGQVIGMAQGAVVSSVTGALNFKTAIKAVIKSVITQVLNDVKDWARAGFRGKPNFVKDWKGLMEASLLDASSEFISKIPLISKFCSPASVAGSESFFNKSLSQGKSTFSQSVKKSASPTNKCNIETIIGAVGGTTANYKKTIDTFSKSWDKKSGSAISVGLMNPNTNMLGLYFQAQDESMMRINKNTAAKGKEATANNGFLNVSNGCIGGSGSGSARAPAPGPNAANTTRNPGAPPGTGTCGNGIRNPVNANGWPEQCDGGDLAGPSQCARFAEFQSGTLACLPTCNYDYSGCTKNTGSGNPITGEKFCPGVLAGNYVKDSLTNVGLGQFSDLIDSNELADLFSAVAQSAFASLSESMSNFLGPIIGSSIKSTSF